MQYHHNLGSLFSEVAQLKEAQPCLRYRDETFTFGSIDRLSTRIASFLIGASMRRGQVVAIAHNKQPMSYALMLACLRLGVTYVNIDTASPQNRNLRILEVSGARMLFYDLEDHKDSMAALAEAHGSEVMLLQEDLLPGFSEEDRIAQAALAQEVDGECIAYIMFTSGSTGVPKGVAVTHQNVQHFIAWGRDRFQVGEQHNFANLSPMYFDNSVFDFYVGLFSGASLTPISRELLNSPYELVEHVAKLQCTVWFSVPSLLIYLSVMKALRSAALPRLEKIIFGGEGYPKTELKKLYDEFSAQAELVNVYGPTECTCICSAHTLGDADFRELAGLPTLGRLNPNFDYMILDKNGRNATEGELCLIGPNVAAGYYNDIQRSAESFKTLHEPDRFMKRMYCTGDLVRLEGGMFYFLGRKDNQIKHMGHRIELEEIEAAVNALEGVVRSAVVYKRHNVSFGKIHCFVESGAGFSMETAMAELRTVLPAYMIPAEMVEMQDLPKNANGKVDRKRLANMV